MCKCNYQSIGKLCNTFKGVKKSTQVTTSKGGSSKSDNQAEIAVGTKNDDRKNDLKIKDCLEKR